MLPITMVKGQQMRFKKKIKKKKRGIKNFVNKVQPFYGLEWKGGLIKEQWMHSHSLLASMLDFNLQKCKPKLVSDQHKGGKASEP